MAGALERYKHLNDGLESMVESFALLMKASHVRSEDDSAGSKQDDAPGELYEVLVEKLVLQVQNVLDNVSELKRNSIVSNVVVLHNNIKTSNRALLHQTELGEMTLKDIKDEAIGLLRSLEENYYGSQHRGPLPVDNTAQVFDDLGIQAAP